MQAELVLPKQLCAISTEELTQLINRVSRGRYDYQKALELKQSAHTTFAVDYADEAYSFCMKLLAENYQYIQKVTLPALVAKIQECLKNLPFKHQLDTIPYFGDLVIGTFLSGLGDFRWFLTVDAVVAWFGLDPSVSRSADKPTGKSRITKRGTKTGRRMMSKGLSYDAAIVKMRSVLREVRGVLRPTRRVCLPPVGFRPPQGSLPNWFELPSVCSKVGKLMMKTKLFHRRRSWEQFDT